MRSVGLGLALVASFQFAVAPAFAQDPPKKPAPAVAPVTSKAPVRTTAATVEAPAKEVVVSDVPAGMVKVHINSPRQVALEKRSGPNSRWEHVCNSPCDIATSVTDEYQILGTELNESKPFILDASGGDKITLDVTPGYHNKAARGGWILAIGALVAVGGVVTILAGSKSTDVPGDNGTVTNNTNTDFISVGSIVIVAGVVAGITGASFMYDNAHTKVDGSIGAVPDRKDVNVKAQVQVTADRTPTWRQDTGPQLAPSHFVSILQGTF